MFESLESRNLMSATLATGGVYVAAGDVDGDGRAEVHVVGSANGGVWKTSNMNAPAPSPGTTHGIIAVLIGL